MYLLILLMFIQITYIHHSIAGGDLTKEKGHAHTHIHTRQSG